MRTVHGGASNAGDVASLVEAARHGSAEAFDALYRSLAGPVASLARAKGSRDEHVVADVVQETFTRALEHLDQLRQPERFAAWVLAIAGHVIVDHHRAGARSRPLDDDEAAQVEATGVPPDAVAEIRELTGLVRRSVAGLSARDATAIALVSHLGLSSSELGVALGVSPGAAKVVLHRARKRLRGALRVQALLERRLTECEQLRSLVHQAGPGAAAHHVETCADCNGREVDLFQHGQVAAIATA